MDYAIVKISGQQYLVSPNEVLSVSNLNLAEGKEFSLEEILLWKEAEKLEIGTPTVSKKLMAKVLKNFKGEKLDVLKFTAKSRYRRKMGFSPMLSQIQIIGEAPKAAVKVTKPIPPKSAKPAAKKSK